MPIPHALCAHLNSSAAQQLGTLTTAEQCQTRNPCLARLLPMAYPLVQSIVRLFGFWLGHAVKERLQVLVGSLFRTLVPYTECSISEFQTRWRAIKLPVVYPAGSYGIPTTAVQQYLLVLYCTYCNLSSHHVNTPPTQWRTYVSSCVRSITVFIFEMSHVRNCERLSLSCHQHVHV